KQRDFRIDLASCIITVRTFMGNSVKYHAAVVFMENLVTKLQPHSLLNDHIARDFGRLSKVGAGTGRHAVITVHNLFSHASAKRSGKDVFKLNDAGIVTVFWWQEPGDAACSAARNNRDLMHRIAVRKNVTDESVACLMVS